MHISTILVRDFISIAPSFSTESANFIELGLLFCTVKPRISLSQVKSCYKTSLDRRKWEALACPKLGMDAQKLQSDIESITKTLDADAIQEHLQTPLLRVSRMFCPELDPKDGAKQVYAFLISYISVGPGNMYSLSKEGKLHNLENIIDAHLVLASRYLSSACDEIERTKDSDSLKSFLSLLHGAYIFHRLLEELNDRFQNFIGIPLTAHDMINANLIAHEVIGDRFANRLDKVVLSLFQQSAITKTIVEAQLNKRHIKKLASENRALSGDMTNCFAAENRLEMSY